MLVQTLLLYAAKKGRSGLQDCSQLLLTKTQPAYDYVAIDATGYVAVVLNNTKNIINQTEQRRQREVGKNVVSMLQEVLTRITCKQSLLIALDGAETLAKVLSFRNGAVNRRVENRLQRLPGSNIMQVVDDRIARMMPERKIVPNEVVFAGVGVSGCVEQKITSWANDLACKSKFNGNTTSLCIIGSGETVLNAIALTPYYDVCGVVQNGTEFRQTKLVDVLDWFRLNEYAKAGKSQLVAHARTDLLFLYMLCYGCAANELIGFPKLNFEQLLTSYHTNILKVMEITNTATNSISSSSSENNCHKDVMDSKNSYSKDRNGSSINNNMYKNVKTTFLFSEEVDNTLKLNLSMLAKVLQNTITVEVPSMYNLLIESYLRHALQSHTMLCLGYVTNVYYLPEYMTLSSSAEMTNNSLSSSSVKKVEDALKEFSSVNLLACVKAIIERSTTSSTTTINNSKNNNDKKCGKLAQMCERDDVTQCDSNHVDKYDNSIEHKINKCNNKNNTVSDNTLIVNDSNTVNKKQKVEEEEEEEEHSLSSTSPPLSRRQYSPFYNSAQPLTAGEYTILCQSKSVSIMEYIQSYVNLALKESVAEQIATASTTTAHQLIREILSYANPEHPHRALCFAPSYCWLQNERTKIWRMRYVDLGVCGQAQQIRRTRNAMSGVNMSVSTSTDGPCVFAESSQAWEPVLHFPFTPLPVNNCQATVAADAVDANVVTGNSKLSKKSQLFSSSSSSLSPLKTIKVVTWNVLFDRYSNQPTPLGKPGVDWCSTKRYPVLSKLIAQEEADVIGMQEVEPVFLSYLAAQDWCKKNYMLSCAPSSPILNPWGVSMLIHTRRLHIAQLRHINVPAWDGHVSLMPVVSLRTLHGLLHVAVAHLLAPFTKNHVNVRTNQDNVLRQRITKYITGDCITMGDFNDWPTNEFTMPAETQYRECWPLLHPNNPGKTMDETNTFCNLKIEEIFFGRSDKVFLRSNHIKPVEAHLIGTRSVNDENENQDAPSYLFPSDHYGVSMTFTLELHSSQNE